jgi:hypothetical protein
MVPIAMIDIGAEQDAAQRPHQEARAEGHEGQQQRGDFVAGRKERLRDVGRVEAEQEEVEHLEEVAAGDPQHGRESRSRRVANGKGGHGSLPCSNALARTLFS